MNSPKIVVMGAGAVGCFFGGMLARAGHDTTLVARQNHVHAIREKGLYMDCLTFQEFVPIQATENLDPIGFADIVLFCVKSPDTQKTIELLKPHLKATTIIVSLQNGVDNCERIRELIDNPVFPAVVYVATAMAGPGILKHNGRGELVIGDWESKETPTEDAATQLQTISTLFQSADVPCTISPDVKRELWFKFLVNCSYNAISAIGQIEYGKMDQVAPIRELITELGREVVQIAQAEGIRISESEAQEANNKIAKTMVTQRSSTAQDIARNKSTEIDYLNGLMVRKGKQHGIPTPANLSVYALVKMIEKYNT